MSPLYQGFCDYLATIIIVFIVIALPVVTYGIGKQELPKKIKE